jgi:NACHT domain
LANPLLKRAAITRIGFEYQDLIGIEVLINFFRDPGLYQWVELESEDREVGSLDDVVAARKDGSFDYVQVKFTADPNKYALDWDWLLERKVHGTSRLRKWATSLSKLVTSGAVHIAELRTNRRPDAEFASALDQNRIQLSRLSAERRKAVQMELGGSEEAKAFFKAFIFRHSETPDVDGLERRLKSKIIPADTTIEGWQLLRVQVRRWATQKNQPEPDGRIRHSHLVQFITKKQPRPIPQNFIVPSVYAIPNLKFHERFLKRTTNGRSSISVLWGTPGRGKSTYLSFLVRALTKERLPVIRHHYFLSLDDTTSDRISFSDVAQSLMSQMAARCSEAIKGQEETPNYLRRWIKACGDFYAKKGKKFYVVIDGLDHVWREQLNTDQMNHLFNYLLPCPKNVVLLVGTQRVADEQLPSRLLRHARPSSWIEIPPMDERAVDEWIRGQYRARRLPLGKQYLNKDDRKDELDKTSGAFFKISRGNPLHLIYSFEALIRRGAPVVTDEIELLPRCPDGDIRRYYRSLWGRLQPQGRQVLHLIAGAEFRWPPEGLRQCGGSIDEVDHLLDHRRTGIVPFHGSIVAYVREQSDHDNAFRALLPRVIHWLQRYAPEFLRWGWLWIAKARNGDERDLLTKTTGTWVIESLASGRPDSQIVAILKEAEKRAFAKRDYCRTIEVRSLKHRVQNGPEFQMHRYPEFIELGIRASENRQQLLNMADEINSLPDEHVVALARSLPSELMEDIGGECEDELRRRVNLWLTLRHRSSSDFVSLVHRWFEVLAQYGRVDVKRVLRFIEGFHDGDGVFRSLLECLVGRSLLEPLLALLSLLKSGKHKHWHEWTEDAVVRVAAIEGVDLRTRITPAQFGASPLLSCWLILNGQQCPLIQGVRYDPALLMRDRHEYGSNINLETFFHSFFFSALALCRTALGNFSFVLPGVDESKVGWMKGALDALRSTAKGIAEGSLPTSFGTPFMQTQGLEPVRGRRTTEADSTQYWSFKVALRQIAIDLHLLSTRPEGSAKIAVDDFATARSSPHWDDIAWLTDNLKNRFLLLERKSAKDLLKDLSTKESGQITAFNERAERWVELGLFALLYDILGARDFAHRAAGCVVGYGYHKDPYVYDVLDAIEQIHQAGIAQALPLLKKVAPIVEQIGEFTDGDDVGTSRTELIDLIAQMSPNRLADCYAHHIRADEWTLAAHTLQTHTKLLNFDDPVSCALVGTFLTRDELLILSKLRDEGRSGAGDAFTRQERFVGGVPLDHDHERTDSTDDFARQGTPPDVTKFAPSRFCDLVDRLSDHRLGYRHQNEALIKWLHHWKDRKKGAEALKSIDAFFAKTERTFVAEGILDEAFLVSLAVQGKKAAYKWLVRAHIVRHGWQSYWTSSKEIEQRLEWAAKYYKDRWREFIADTSKQEPFWERRDYGFSMGLRYLVRFLILVDQKSVAAKYCKTLVEILVDELDDQPIAEVPWLH